ncbi:glycoside hydrolase family 3 N-terminal domain-containing protein [Lachnospiraceae bacterium 54-53]
MKSIKLMVLTLVLPLVLAGCGRYLPDSQGGPEKQSTQKPEETGKEIRISTESSSGEPGPFAGDDSPEAIALKLLSAMTPEEKVGQMFFVRLRKDQAAEDIEAYHPGGYILFGDDFKDETKTSIKELIDSYQSASAIPLLIGVDEEGGTVCRVSRHKAFRSEPFPSPQELYGQGGLEAVREDAGEKAAFLLELGINVNLAPVCDVSVDPNDFIYRRSFGQDAPATADYVKTMVLEMEKAHIGSTLKHFPGYGSNADTHTETATDNRDYEQFVTSDFLPFVSGIEAGAGSILVSHNIVTSMDGNYPASLSPAVHDILRNSLNFKGVIMTDDLSMEAVKGSTPDTDAAVLAVAAGNDLLISTDFETQIPAVLEALKNGTVREELIDASVKRILLWKLKLGLINQA